MNEAQLYYDADKECWVLDYRDDEGNEACLDIDIGPGQESFSVEDLAEEVQREVYWPADGTITVCGDGDLPPRGTITLRGGGVVSWKAS